MRVGGPDKGRAIAVLEGVLEDPFECAVAACDFDQTLPGRRISRPAGWAAADVGFEDDVVSIAIGSEELG